MRKRTYRRSLVACGLVVLAGTAGTALAGCQDSTGPTRYERAFLKPTPEYQRQIDEGRDVRPPPPRDASSRRGDADSYIAGTKATARRRGAAMDAELERRVRDSIARDPLGDLRDIKIKVRDGVVYLEGRVRDDSARRDLIARAHTVAGVDKVVPKLATRKPPGSSSSYGARPSEE